MKVTIRELHGAEMGKYSSWPIHTNARVTAVALAQSACEAVTPFSL